jgi:hypothetical protein
MPEFKENNEEPASQIKLYLVRTILGGRGFKLVQMKSQNLFKVEIITELQKIGWGHLENCIKIHWTQKLRFP